MLISTRTLLLTIVLTLNSCNSYKILIVPCPGKSHVLALTEIAKELVGRGHGVSMLFMDTFPVPKELESNRSGITIERYYPADGDDPVNFEELMENATLMMMESGADLWKLQASFVSILEADSRRLLMNNDKMFEKLNQSRLDIALVEGLFMTKYFYLVPHRLGIPWVSYTDILNPMTVKVPWLPSFIPHMLTTYSDKMTLTERLKNTVISTAFSLYDIMPGPPKEILDTYQQYGAFDSLDDLMSRSLLWLLTKDVVLDYARPAMPHFVDVGGLTAKPASGSLAEEFSQFMSSAKKGTILVTFGTTYLKLPVEIAEKFMSAFRQLPDYHIIWRFQNKDNLIVPDNVMLVDWLPQNDILADERLKLFITHSGNNGQFEAIYHGVPMIGCPVHGDQPYNAARLEAKGYGIAMDIHSFTSDQLHSNILTIVNDRRYKERTTLASKILKSAPQTPQQRAAYWIEHVIKFGGKHLRSASSDLSVFQYYMLDILSLILVVLIATTALLIFFVKMVIKKCARKKTKPKYE